jgi:ribosome-associated protein
MRLDKVSKTAVAALEDIKARDVVVLDVRKITPLFDRLIIASGDSTRQIKALARNVAEKVKEAGGPVCGIEGEDAAEWVLVDLGSTVVHIMHPAVRQYYNLEELWGSPRAPAAPRKRASRAKA